MKIDIGGFSIDLGKLGASIAAGFGPGVLQGAILQWFSKYSAKELYEMAMGHKDEDIWERIPEDWQENIALAHRKSGILNKVDIEWLIDALKKARPDLASLVMNSKETRAFLRKQLNRIKKHAEQFDSGKIV